MKTNLKFLQWLIILIFSVTTLETSAQVTTDPDHACLNSSQNYSVLISAGSTYNWVVSGGGTITSGQTTNQITILWTTVGSYTVTVTETLTSTTGCIGIPVVLNVIVDPLPLPTLSGSASVCVASTGNIYTTEAGMTNYAWVVSPGGTITAGGTTTNNTVTVTWNTAGPQTVQVNYLNANLCTAALPTIYDVTVNPLPVVTLSGPSPACINSTGNVYTTQAGMTTYAWLVSAGGTITAGGSSTDNTVTVTWNTATPQTVSVNYHNANNCTAAASTSFPVTVNPLPIVTLGGLSPVCVNATGIVYTTESGMTNYTWLVSAGGTITAGGTTTDNTVTITWTSATPQTVSVNYTNATACTAATPTVFNVTVNPLPVITLSGNTPICVNSLGNVYTTESGMTNYLWNISAGGTITSGGGTTSNTVTITWLTVAAQTVSINYTNGNNCVATIPHVLNITVSPLPATSPIYHY